jgi:hypothetical protein
MSGACRLCEARGHAIFVLKKMRLFTTLQALSVLFLFQLWTVISCAQGNSISAIKIPDNRYKISFIWKSGTENGHVEKHEALLLPVKLLNCPKQFYMQFDLGAPTTIFYKNKLASISQKYPGLVPNIDTAAKLKEIVFSIGKKRVKATEINLIKTSEEGIDWDKDVQIIGTIGADFIDNRSILINYPKQYIEMNSTIPARRKAEAADFTYMQRNIMFPVTVRGKKTMLYFDTGSSSYELLTSRDIAESFAEPGASATKSTALSWGNTLYVYSLPTTDSIEITSQKLPITKVSYVEGASEEQVNRMLKLGIGGVTGNKLFLHSKLFLDTKNKKFLVFP